LYLLCTLKSCNIFSFTSVFRQKFCLDLPMLKICPPPPAPPLFFSL
jgi:hypothetical protein